jgi:hypothetical protein
MAQRYIKPSNYAILFWMDLLIGNSTGKSGSFYQLYSIL